MASILVTGAAGQIGTDLVGALRRVHGHDAVLGSDLHAGSVEPPYVLLDALDRDRLTHVVVSHGITTIYHLASLLSARGEAAPDLAWRINLDTLRNVLAVAQAHHLRVFWPSSIAAFGPDADRLDTPQSGPLTPTTMYGITKVAGELLCNYAFTKFGVDVRSVRYPGLISYSAMPGGGTTDFAVDMFHAAAKGEPYTCFVRPDTRLPMLYMPDALRATIDIMAAPPEALTVRTSYNLTGMSFTADALASAIRRRLPSFEIVYAPDHRQAIADSWPQSIDDRQARTDWGWRPAYDLDALVDDMLMHLGAR